MIAKKILIYFILTLTFSSIYSKEMNIWIMPNGANSKGALEAILEPYEKASGNSVNVTVLDWGIAWNKISTNLKDQEKAPNIVQLGTTWIGHFATLNQLSILNGEIYKPQRFYDKFFDLTHLHNDINYYTIPFFSDTRVFLANKKYVDSLKINPNIETYPEFLHLLYTVKKSNLKLDDGTVVTPYSFPGKQDWNIPHNFAPWVWSNGGQFIKYKNKKWESALLDSGTIIGIHKYINFALDSLANQQTLKENSAVVSQRFIRGETAVIYSTLEILKKIKISTKKGGLKESQIGKDGLYILKVPSGSSGSVTFSGGSHLAIPKKFETDRETFHLLNFLTSSNVIRDYNNEIGFFPPDTTLWEESSIGSDMMQIIPLAKSSRSYPQIAEWGQVEALLIQYLSDVWSLVEDDYSAEILYEKTIFYNNKINALFDVNDTSVISKGNFMGICDSINSHNIADSYQTETTDDSNILNNLNEYFEFDIITYILYFLLFIFLLALFIKRM